MAIDHKCPARSDKKIQRRGRRDWQFTWHKRSASEEEAPKCTRKNQHLEYWPQSAASVSQNQGTMTTSNRSQKLSRCHNSHRKRMFPEKRSSLKRKREREKEKEGEEGEEIRVRARIIVWHVSRVAATRTVRCTASAYLPYATYNSLAICVYNSKIKLRIEFLQRKNCLRIMSGISHFKDWGLFWDTLYITVSNNFLSECEVILLFSINIYLR